MNRWLVAGLALVAAGIALQMLALVLRAAGQ